MAAEQGLDIAQNNLGVMLFESGRVEEAERYLRLSAEQKCVEAYDSLAELLESTGRAKEAKKYHKLLAKQDND